MFNALLTKAQQSVDNALSEIASKSMVAIPFLIASGFAVAAVAIRLHKLYDAEMANLILASSFAALGLMAAIVTAIRRRSSAKASVQAPVDAPAVNSEQPASSLLSEPDREVLMAALTTAVPMAAPYVLRSVFKNLPIVAVLAGAAYILTRQPQSDVAPIIQPAE